MHILLATKLLDGLSTVHLVIVNIIGIFYLNQLFYMLASMFLKKRQYHKARKYHQFGYVIAARNEAAVIGQLIDSIWKQNYAKDKMHVFVIADNCTDDTAKVAREHGAMVFERFSETEKGKSYALKFGLKQILEQLNNANIEAFFIFDADNLLDQNYTSYMNNVYDEGYHIATGFRDSKNFGDSWVAGGSSYMYYREGREVHRVRAKMNSGTYVSGTGFMIDRSIVEQNEGWKHHTLIEDIEFSVDLATHGQKIMYCEDAVFYDEQPVTLKASLRQRLRWCKGTHQVFGKYQGGLWKSMFRKITLFKWDMLCHIGPLPVILLVWLILYNIIGGTYCIAYQLSFFQYFQQILSPTILAIVIPMLIGLINGLLLCIQVWKRVRAPWYKKIWYAVLFPIFMVWYLPLSVIALFKNVTWKQIPHIKVMTIEELDKK